MPNRKSAKSVRVLKDMGGACSNPIGQALVTPLLATSAKARRDPQLAEDVTIANMKAALVEIIAQVDNLGERMRLMEQQCINLESARARLDERAELPKSEAVNPSDDSEVTRVVTYKQENNSRQRWKEVRDVIHTPGVLTDDAIIQVKMAKKTDPEPQPIKEEVVAVEDVTLNDIESCPTKHILTQKLSDIPVERNVNVIESAAGIIPTVGKKKVFCVDTTSDGPRGRMSVLKLFNAKRAPAKILNLRDVCDNAEKYFSHHVEIDTSNLSDDEAGAFGLIAKVVSDILSDSAIACTRELSELVIA